MSKKILFPFFLALLAIKSFAFGTKLDSLISLMRHAENDSIKVGYLNKIAFGLSTAKPNQALDYVNRAINISQMDGYKKGLADAHHVKGILMSNMQLYQAAISNFNLALALRTKINDQRGMSATLTNLGSAYLKINKINKTIFYYKRSLDVDKKLNDNSAVAADCGNLGLVYWQKNEYDSARYFFGKALTIYRQKADMGEVASTLSNIGASWFYQGEMEKALYFFSKSYDSYKSVKSYKGMAIALSNVAQILEKMKKYNVALRKRMGALYIWKKRKDSASTAQTYIKISENYALQNALNKALKYADSAYNFSDSIASLPLKMSAIKLVSDLQRKMGNNKAALASFKTYTLLNDSMNKMKFQHKVNQEKLKALFSTNVKSDSSIAIAKKDTNRHTEVTNLKHYLWIFGGTILLLILIFVFFTVKMKRK